MPIMPNLRKLTNNDQEVQVNTYASGNQSKSSVTVLSNGQYVVVWQSYGQDGSSFGVYGQRYDANENRLGNEFQVNTSTNDSQQSPAVAALANGEFVIAWQSLQDSINWNVYAQRYDANGNRLGNEFQVNTYANNGQLAPVITALADGGFVIVWQSIGQDGNAEGIYAQRYDANGNRLGSEFQVNSHTYGNQDTPSITALTNGGFVVTWQSYLQDGEGYGVYVQIYDVNGNLVGNELKVNHTAAAQYAPSIAALTDGGFVITWVASRTSNSSYSGILGVRCDANGNRLGNEFQVNTYTGGSHDAPSVVTLADGKFVIVWQSSAQDGSGWGIYIRPYDLNGNPLNREFLVNTYTIGNQLNPSVAAVDNKTIIVTWESDGQDSSGLGVYKKVYNLDDIIPIPSVTSTVTSSTTSSNTPAITPTITANNSPLFSGSETKTITQSSTKSTSAIPSPSVTTSNSAAPSSSTTQTAEATHSSTASVTPSTSAIPSPSVTTSNSAAASSSNIQTAEATHSSTASVTPSTSAIPSPSVTTSYSAAASSSTTQTAEATHSSTASVTPSTTAVPSSSVPASNSATTSPSNTKTAEVTHSSTPSAIGTASSTASPTASITSTSSNTGTATHIAAVSSTSTISSTANSSPSSQATITSSQSISSAQSPSKTGSASEGATPSKTVVVSTTPTATVISKEVVTKTSSVTATPTAHRDNHNSITPSFTHTASPSSSKIYIHKETGNRRSFNGTSDNEKIIIDADNITVTGGGGLDIFKVEKRPDSFVRIADFALNEIIDLSDLGIKNFNDLPMSQQNSDVIINTSGQTIIIANTNEEFLGNENFIFATHYEEPTPFWKTAWGYVTIVTGIVGPIATLVGTGYGIYKYIKARNQGHPAENHEVADAMGVAAAGAVPGIVAAAVQPAGGVVAVAVNALARSVSGEHDPAPYDHDAVAVNIVGGVPGQPLD